MNPQSHGAKRKTPQRKGGAPKKANSRKQTRGSRKVSLPQTMKLPSKKSNDTERKKFSRASTGMNMTELQFLAKSRGIPFGGLTKTKLIRKINNYY